MTYRILESNSPDELSIQVNEAISQGWVPLGGVSVSYNDYLSTDHDDYREENEFVLCCQAMTKSE